MPPNLIVGSAAVVVVTALWLSSLGRWTSVEIGPLITGCVDGSVLIQFVPRYQHVFTFESLRMSDTATYATLYTEHAAVGFGFTYDPEADELVFPLWLPLLLSVAVPAALWWRQWRRRCSEARRGFEVHT